MTSPSEAPEPKRTPPGPLDEEGAQRAIAYLRASFPHAGSFLTVANEDAIRRRLVGRNRDDVIVAIDGHADTSDKISISALLEGIKLACDRRLEREEAQRRASQKLLPAPPPPSKTHRQKVVLAARAVAALTVLRGIEWTEEAAATNYRLCMTTMDDAQLAEYVGDLERECARLGKLVLGDFTRALPEEVVTP